jgi:hypothetical protein
MEETETWLYNNHEETLNKATIENIFHNTTAPGQKIYKRKADWEALEQALNFLKNGINSNLNRFKFNLNAEGKPCLNEKELQDVSNLIHHYNEIYNKTINSINKLPKFVDCPVNASEISKSAGELEDKINRVIVEAEKRGSKFVPQNSDGNGPHISDQSKKENMDLD